MNSSHLEEIYQVEFSVLDDLRGIDGKFHYFYKIVNNLNNNFYYGIHSTYNINDYYAGSGTVLKVAYKKYNKKNFTKYILKFFDDRKSLLEYEKLIVDKELTESESCYNMVCGGQDPSDLNFDSEYFKHTTNGLIHINNGILNKMIKSSELSFYLNNGWKKGQLHKSCKDKIIIHNSENKELFIYPDEFQKYSDKGWVKGGKSRNKGQISFTKNCIWVNNGQICKRVSLVELQQYLNNGWQKGAIQRYTKGYIRITNGVEDKNIPPEDVEKLKQYLDDGWKLGSHTIQSDRIWINKDGKDIRVKIENIQQYLDDGWKRGRSFKFNTDGYRRGKKYIFKDNVIKAVFPENIQQYLDDGWMLGNPKNHKPCKNKNKIRVNKDGKTIHINKIDIQQYLDDGWVLGNANKGNMKGRIRVNNGVEERLITEEEFKTYDLCIWKRGIIRPRKHK